MEDGKELQKAKTTEKQQCHTYDRSFKFLQGIRHYIVGCQMAVNLTDRSAPKGIFGTSNLSGLREKARVCMTEFGQSREIYFDYRELLLST